MHLDEPLLENNKIETIIDRLKKNNYKSQIF
jgi:hypothetical protein